MRVIHVFIAAVCLLGATLAVVAEEKRGAAHTAEKAPDRNVTLQAILISASNEKGETDRRLAAYAKNLKSSLRFESFKYLGEGSTRIEMPGNSEISLPQNQKVVLEAAYYGEGMVWLRVIWRDGDRQFMNNVYAKWKRGTPIVIGGAARGGESLVIIVTPR